MLVDYAVTDMGLFGDDLDAAPRAKKMRGNGLTTILLRVAQYITFHPFYFFYSNTYFQSIIEVILFNVRFQGY